MYELILIDYGELGIRYTIVDKTKTGKDFIIKEFKDHKQALKYMMEQESKQNGS